MLLKALFSLFPGKIFINDFINELNDQSYQITEEERNKLVNVSDGKGQVKKEMFTNEGSVTSTNPHPITVIQGYLH